MTGVKVACERVTMRIASGEEQIALNTQTLVRIMAERRDIHINIPNNYRCQAYNWILQYTAGKTDLLSHLITGGIFRRPSNWVCRRRRIGGERPGQGPFSNARLGKLF